MTHEEGWMEKAWEELIEKWKAKNLNQYGIIPKKYIIENND